MRTILTLAAGLAMTLALAACQKPAATAVTSDDMSLGNPAAKVTVIEYASVACPFCAQWNNTVYPAFKAKYIDSGKVRYIAREALTGEPTALAAAGFLTARCAGKDKYFQVVDAIYHDQQEAQSGQTREVLLKIAKAAGLSEARFDACITDPKALTALNARWQRYVQDDKITGTPTFIINGKTYTDPPTLAEMDTAIAEAQGAGKPR